MSWMDRTREKESRSGRLSVGAIALIAIVVVLVIVAVFWRA
jgi:hypothetical protein